MGSIEMTDYERRQLAAQSLEANVRDENFCELFPDLTVVKSVNIKFYAFIIIIYIYLFVDNSKRNRKTKFS
jgi:hypothetical protein